MKKSHPAFDGIWDPKNPSRFSVDAAVRAFGHVRPRPLVPGHLEVVGGKLYINDEQRMLLLWALLDHVGTVLGVSMGSLEAWQAAIEKRQKSEGSV